ncbi:MAG: hypothetical protein SPL78_10755 [Bacteroidales bacterium]|nr:hypothetical protein [Bacteroidales bacterium]
MTLKELKEIIKGKRIDRVASFCKSYEQMFDRCRIDVHNGSIVIDTSDDGDNSDQFEPVPKVIDQLLAMPSEYDDYPILKSGFDNNNDNGLLVRQVICVRFEHSHSGGTGLKLLGRESLRFIDDVDDDEFLYYESVYHVEFIIEDPRAQKLNEKFTEFIHASCNWPFDIERLDEDMMFLSYFDDATLLSFTTDEGTSANLIALISGSFNGVYFTRTPLNSSTDVERLSNDLEGKYFGPCQAVVYPAYIPDYNAPHLTEIASSTCYAKECATVSEMEQFIASHNPDEAVGDLVRRITTRYIDDPITLILE